MLAYMCTMYICRQRDKYTPENIVYYAQYVFRMLQYDMHRIKYIDEASFVPRGRFTDQRMQAAQLFPI